MKKFAQITMSQNFQNMRVSVLCDTQSSHKISALAQIGNDTFKERFKDAETVFSTVDFKTKEDAERFIRQVFTAVPANRVHVNQ